MGNKIAFVTGAAGGIGEAVTRALGSQGTTVAAADRDTERLAETVEKCELAGLKVRAYPLDVTRPADVEAVVDQVERDLGPIDQLVNAAGILRMGAARELSDADFADTFAVNVTGVFNVSRAVTNRMVPRRRGALVTVASNSASTPRTGMAAYAASKAAATMYTKVLGLEVAEHGIRCNLVQPGSTATPMLTSMWHDETGRQTTLEGNLDAYRLGIPLKKLAQPSDIADAVLFLLSDRACHITLHELTVDGGATLGV
ncbi:2,3-dihydro-2,3-dihydroxybenzoate dehydrogenase [Amycolatopsis xylanica]|uniref:2,3-dihydro-2,3-dihydroxybenzoate dehydrogenase n=1 Tax=Amycolatopsis xylanica TaxID=589385 RepID=A0A1H3P469_9PSEU|nr:2,3-dihydro-2,3-dihydroxybenzoate dehydrogenase [Amycolatopsis xylanica]SDY95902.1 2,3-dihydro-2,3-dihydroxybenzoate dehydrogenase [Amycolatopsis xylanica]